MLSTKSIIAASVLLFSASSALAAVTKPGAPIMGSATVNITTPWIANTGSATVTFTPPLSNGGAVITSYTVSCSPACTPVIGSASPITVKGLTDNTQYTYTVAATNSVGTGVASAASNAAPVCDGTPLSGTSVSGYLRGNGEAWSYKTAGGGEANCDPALGCDGYVGFGLYKCSNHTGPNSPGADTHVYVYTGPAKDNALLNLIYYQKQAGKKVSYWVDPTMVGGGYQIHGSYPIQ